MAPRILAAEGEMAEPIKTEHPYITRTPGVVGGRAAIAGTRISVDFIAELMQAGWDADEIIATYPHLKPAAVYDAISYFLDHQEEINHYLAENTLEKVLARAGATVNGTGQVVFSRDRAPVSG
jgi:uncharacterized protein (DUF433 family)